MGQPTIKDVAKLAGVSISTVSRVMNKSKPVSPEAERKVVDAINKLGFKPNELARSLVMKKTNSIGILVKDIGIDYMAEMVRGAEEIGRMYNYDILLSSTYGNLELEKKAVDFLFRKQVEGLILLAENIEPEIIVKIREYKLPYVLLDKFYKANDYHTVSVNYEEAMSDLTEYVISLNHKKIIYLRTDRDYDICKEKILGYQKAMQKHHLTPIEVSGGKEGEEAGYRCAEKIEEELGALSKAADAYICENNHIALSFMNYCYEQGIPIPDQVQLAGFGNIKFARDILPHLTILAEPYYDIGAVAMRVLTKELQNGEKLTESIDLPTQIYEGDTIRKRDYSLK